MPAPLFAASKSVCGDFFGTFFGGDVLEAVWSTVLRSLQEHSVSPCEVRKLIFSARQRDARWLGFKCRTSQRRRYILRKRA